MKKLIFLLLTVAFVSIQACKPKDADIKTAVDTAISSVSGVSASVTEGVVTLTGTVASEDVKATAENAAKAVKGVKSVTNSINVVVPVISGDVVLNEALKSVMTTFPGITAVAKDSVIILTGDVKRADLQKVIQAAQALKPKKVENMLTIK
jgi:osmotically-inducible protein OsmY